MIKTKSGGKLVNINRQWIVGEGTLNDIQTSQIENMNGIARGSQSILVRKTKSFAKKIDRVDMMYELFQVHRNFMKQDKNKTTPSMKEDIQDTPLNWVDFLKPHYQT